MIVKVCGLRDVQNLKQIIKLPINWIGIIFYKSSSRYAEATGVDSTALSLFDISDFGLKKVGVFVNEKLEGIKRLAQRYKLDYLQLHGEESPEFCQQLKSQGYKVVKAFAVDDAFDFSILEQYTAHCSYFLFDTKGTLQGGHGVTFNWNILNKYSLDVPFILSGGIGPEAIPALTAFKHPQLAGIDLNSKFEQEPGLKDTKRLATFVDSFRAQQLTA